MDIRIVHTCNNNCLYCLEQTYRGKEAFIDVGEIYQKLECHSGDTNLTFYGGNPLLHPNLYTIILESKKYGFTNIGILSNSGYLEETLLIELISAGLTGFGLYFNSLSERIHEIVTQQGVSFQELMKNMKLLSGSKIHLKLLIHVNALNIKRLYKDIQILNDYFSIQSFEFINYFPFDRPYEKYRDILQYNIDDNRRNIDSLFEVLIKSGKQFSFHKMSQDFFGNYKKYYDREICVNQHISDEDILRISHKNPHCLEEKRCPSCFIKDKCLHYDRVTS